MCTHSWHTQKHFLNYPHERSLLDFYCFTGPCNWIRNYAYYYYCRRQQELCNTNILRARPCLDCGICTSTKFPGTGRGESDFCHTHNAAHRSASAMPGVWIIFARRQHISPAGEAARCTRSEGGLSKHEPCTCGENAAVIHHARGHLSPKPLDLRRPLELCHNHQHFGENLETRAPANKLWAFQPQSNGSVVKLPRYIIKDDWWRENSGKCNHTGIFVRC